MAAGAKLMLDCFLERTVVSEVDSHLSRHGLISRRATLNNMRFGE